MIVQYVFENKWKWTNEQTTRTLIKPHLHKSSPAWKNLLWIHDATTCIWLQILQSWKSVWADAGLGTLPEHWLIPERLMSNHCKRHNVVKTSVSMTLDIIKCTVHDLKIMGSNLVRSSLGCEVLLSESYLNKNINVMYRPTDWKTMYEFWKLRSNTYEKEL